MKIRSFQPGDEQSQVAIFNGAACLLPGFKPSKVDDVLKRTRARGFDPSSRWYAEVQGEVVGYCVLEPGQSRISYPWCRRGHDARELLFAAALASAQERGLTKLFAAYRQDWQIVLEFFDSQGFSKTREMVNYAVDVLDLPTTAIGAASRVTRFQQEDIPALAEMGKGLLQLPVEKLRDYYFANPYFPSECLSVLRSRDDSTPLAVGIAIERSTFADATKIDSSAPCFRLGAFGTEGLNAKRVNGLFSYLVSQPESAIQHGLTLLAEALDSMTEGSVNAVATQVPSDAPHLVEFYNRYFKFQGRFPVYERRLG